MRGLLNVAYVILSDLPYKNKYCWYSFEML